MRWIVGIGRAVMAAATLSLFAVAPGFAQGVTTGAIAGMVSDSIRGPLEGARVVAVHGPSGTTYAAITRADGRFTIPGMRVGGPYRVSASRVGYRQEVQNGVTVSLGVTSDLEFRLAQASVQLEAVTVETSAAGSIFSSQRTGAATTVSTQQLAHLPTISRRVEDLLRLTPQYSPMSFGFSFAGQDNRLNNMTIDGSYFNNSFGLAGQPGDRTGVTPVSLDALEQVQVNIAPYDVRQGNFVGAGVNMVTKSGGNDFTGSVFYNTRSNDFVGTQAGPNKFNPGTFQYRDVGISLGGPIIRNKLFFFSSFEDDRQTAPGTTFTAWDGVPADTGANITRVLASDLDALSTYLRTNFNYETGPYQDYDFKTPSTRFITRLDYNINDRNKLSLRYNLLNSETPVLISNSGSDGLGNRRSTRNSLNFANSNYAILENIRSIVGEWNSSLGSNKSNNLILGYNTSNESRKNIKGPWFPEVEILSGPNQPNYTTFGFEPFTPDNQLYYHSYQLQDNFTLYLPKHSVTLGVSVEKYHSKNVFFDGAQSIYVYNSLADFYTDANDYLANPNRTVSPVTLRLFQVRYNNIAGLSEPVQPLDVLYAGAYAQDEWRPTRNLTLTAGLRIDAPKFKNTAYDNAVADTMTFRDARGAPVHYNSGALPGVNPLFSPRFGFNYDVGGRQNTQIRGGTGIFTGRPAYVWISNQVGNTGVLTGFISASNTTAYPFNPDPDHYKPAPTNQPEQHRHRPAAALGHHRNGGISLFKRRERDRVHQRESAGAADGIYGRGWSSPLDPEQQQTLCERYRRHRTHESGAGVFLERRRVAGTGVPERMVRKGWLLVRGEQEHGGRGLHRDRLVERKPDRDRPEQSGCGQLAVLSRWANLRRGFVHARLFRSWSDERQCVLRWTQRRNGQLYLLQRHERRWSHQRPDLHPP